MIVTVNGSIAPEPISNQPNGSGTCPDKDFHTWFAQSWQSFMLTLCSCGLLTGSVFHSKYPFQASNRGTHGLLNHSQGPSKCSSGSTDYTSHMHIQYTYMQYNIIICIRSCIYIYINMYSIWTYIQSSIYIYIYTLYLFIYIYYNKQKTCMYSNCKVDAYCIQPWSSSSKSLDWKANLGVGSGGLRLDQNGMDKTMETHQTTSKKTSNDCFCCGFLSSKYRYILYRYYSKYWYIYIYHYGFPNIQVRYRYIISGSWICRPPAPRHIDFKFPL